jgi:hypothetical protein
VCPIKQLGIKQSDMGCAASKNTRSASTYTPLYDVYPPILLGRFQRLASCPLASRPSTSIRARLPERAQRRADVGTQKGRPCGQAQRAAG